MVYLSSSTSSRQVNGQKPDDTSTGETKTTEDSLSRKVTVNPSMRMEGSTDVDLSKGSATEVVAKLNQLQEKLIQFTEALNKLKALMTELNEHTKACTEEENKLFSMTQYVLDCVYRDLDPRNKYKELLDNSNITSEDFESIAQKLIRSTKETFNVDFFTNYTTQSNDARYPLKILSICAFKVNETPSYKKIAIKIKEFIGLHKTLNEIRKELDDAIDDLSSVKDISKETQKNKQSYSLLNQELKKVTDQFYQFLTENKYYVIEESKQAVMHVIYELFNQRINENIHESSKVITINQEELLNTFYTIFTMTDNFVYIASCQLIINDLENSSEIYNLFSVNKNRVNFFLRQKTTSNAFVQYIEEKLALNAMFRSIADSHQTPDEDFLQYLDIERQACEKQKYFWESLLMLQSDDNFVNSISKEYQQMAIDFQFSFFKRKSNDFSDKGLEQLRDKVDTFIQNLRDELLIPYTTVKKITDNNSFGDSNTNYNDLKKHIQYLKDNIEDYLTCSDDITYELRKRILGSNPPARNRTRSLKATT